ncbi:DUF2796 domain-containing protein [Sulfuricystis multivorans]|uniref:DUF2796 domain-containing protein n=1 Tax=Sulfuricystis multivorans TaxID=2211108 RepID=UPI0015593BE2|nr:DUF2796 domain-containing protein [Sulfuricystis multivorans]
MPKVLPVLAALTFALPVLAQHRHVHGEGRLEAVLDQDNVMLELELPLDAAVGFERAPRNEKEKAALDKAVKTLKDAAALWRFPAAAGCVVQDVAIELPKFDGGEHADLAARYLIRCSNPAALKEIETTLFTTMPRLYRLEAQRVGPSGQGAQRLTPKAPVLAW